MDLLFSTNLGHMLSPRADGIWGSYELFCPILLEKNSSRMVWAPGGNQFLQLVLPKLCEFVYVPEKEYRNANDF